MPLYKFTDNDFAVIQDSLTTNRERIREMGMATPNMDETMAKWGGWAHPTGCEFVVLTGVDMWLILGANGDPDYDEAKYQAAVQREQERAA